MDHQQIILMTMRMSITRPLEDPYIYQLLHPQPLHSEQQPQRLLKPQQQLADHCLPRQLLKWNLQPQPLHQSEDAQLTQPLQALPLKGIIFAI